MRPKHCSVRLQPDPDNIMRLSNSPFANPFEELESPFLSEELLSVEPATEANEVQFEDTWQEAEDTHGFAEVEHDTPPDTPSTAADFLGGRLWTFTATTVPVRVSVFCPKSLNPQKPIDMLVYAHGDLGGCKPYPKVIPEDLITKAPFHLGKIVDESKRRIALVVPFMDWEKLRTNKLSFVACNRPDASLHVLGVPGNLNGVMKEALAEIGRVLGAPPPSVANLILAGHSRAHGFFNTLALHHMDSEMSKGVLRTLKEVWCLDSTYFCFMAEWTRWLTQTVNLTASVFYRIGKGAATYGTKLAAAAKTMGGGKLVVTALPGTADHCAVPAKHIPGLLTRSVHYTASEVSDELEDAEQFADAAAEQELEDEEAAAFDEEVIGTDSRAIVGNTLAVPNRWICAIDILTANPDWPKKGSKFLIKSRGTGILIGPKYVLTARHVVGTLGLNAASVVKGVGVSPARNGSNSSHPFGKATSSNVRHSQPYFITRTQRDSSGTHQIRVQVRDDYALIILDKDLAVSTHSKIKGTLDYWGKDPALAQIRRLDPATIDKKDIEVTGYPGDTCGTTKYSGSSKQNQIDNCWNWSNDAWASTQWRSSGTLDVVNASSRVLYHTADTYEGQSGAPITMMLDGQLHLVGIHTAGDNAQRNKGLRLTRLMLEEIRDWINADAGYTMASLQNDALVLQPASGGATKSGTNKEIFEADYFEQPELDQEDLELEGDDEFVGVESEDDEDEVDLAHEWPLEERFDPNDVPEKARAARDKGDLALAVTLAIEGGMRSESDLTNLVFCARHPDQPIGPLKKDDPNYATLSAEWKKILAKEVRPAIANAVENTSLKVSAKYVLERDPMFAGDTGAKFKALIEEVAREVDLNPGFLAAVLLAEWDKRSLYLSKGAVTSFVSGTDDFYAMREQLKDNVPAFSKVRFDPVWTTDINEHKRKVKTVTFTTGKDATLATAVYLKYAEIKLRKAAAKNGGDFDKFPLETRFALVRVAMAAGHGGIAPDGEFVWFKRKDDEWVKAKKGQRGAVLRGVAPRLATVLKGGDFLVRKHEPRRDPTNSAHITNRNATILVAQALHLSDWMFGIPLTTTSQPEVEEFDAEYADDETVSDLVAEEV
jgi:V8-like Glu-specific endopeptidase